MVGDPSFNLDWNITRLGQWSNDDVTKASVEKDDRSTVADAHSRMVGQKRRRASTPMARLRA
jgi:hypothetical protein